MAKYVREASRRITATCRGYARGLQVQTGGITQYHGPTAYSGLAVRGMQDAFAYCRKTAALDWLIVVLLTFLCSHIGAVKEMKNSGNKHVYYPKFDNFQNFGFREALKVTRGLFGVS